MLWKYLIDACLDCLAHNAIVCHLLTFSLTAVMTNILCMLHLHQHQLNDLCEFPFELDMEPYTQEYLDKQERKARTSSDSSTNSADDTTVRPPGYYNYHLTGVVVHTGTADSGHYYSYVKERTGSSGTITASSTTDASARWLWFNDSSVSVIEQDKLRDACSGGVEHDNRGDTKVCM
jgi:Ubiquitin carboxyl-terminal hydrolase